MDCGTWDRFELLCMVGCVVASVAHGNDCVSVCREKEREEKNKLIIKLCIIATQVLDCGLSSPSLPIWIC